MGNEVKVSVRHELDKIIDALQKVREANVDVQQSFDDTAKKTEKGVERGTKNTETMLTKVRGFARRMADQIKQDFMSLASINALGESMRISNQFKGAVKESFELSDAIRKLGGVFGLTRSQFGEFQNKLTKGLGAIGLSSDVATNSLQGLSQTTVRGQENLVEYSKAAGMLASISREQGQEGNIAGGIARVLTARGQNPNDMKAMSKVSEDLRRTFLATGKGPTETLRVMEDIFSKMPEDLRKSISTRGLAQLASTAQIAGPGGTDFITAILGKSPIARQALEAQGFGKIFSDKGLDVEKFGKASKSVLGRVGGDPRLAAKTLGLSDEAAEGFIRLTRSLDRVAEAQANVEKMTGSLAESYQQSMGFGEAFRANINRIKRVFSEPLAALSQGGADLMSKASQSDLGAAGIVGGGGLLAALLAGGALRGIGKGLGGGIMGSVAKGAAASAVTGKEVQPVYVVNAAEIAAGGALGGGLGGAKGLLSKIPGLGGIAAGVGRAAGVAGGALSSPVALGAGAIAAGGYAGFKLSEATRGTSFDEKIVKPMMTELITAMQNLGILKKQEIVGPGGAQQMTQKMIVELNERQLKASKQPTRGSSF